MHRQKGEKILMYDRENDNRNNNEGRQVQQELEDQLRAFGDTMTDAFAHGFEGRGMDIGDRAWDVGKAAVHAANYGIGEAAKAFRQGRRGYPYGDAKQPFREGAADADPAGMPGWFRQIFAKPEPTPVESIRISAKKRHSAGCTLLAVGITFAVIFGLGTLGCLIGLGTISPAALGDVVVSATEGGGILMTGTDYVMNTAYNVLGIVSSVLGLATAGFGWMTACGAARMKAGRQMGQFADYADSVDYHKGLPVSMLADLTRQTKKKALKKLRSYIHKGWLNAWLDDETETLYLTAEDYRAAKEKAAAAAAQPQPEKEETGDAPLNLDTARRFAAVLEKEQQLMQDAQAREELAAMHKTTTAICDWLEAHPESQPKTRRFAEYYIPTTLKLLHTYNDVQGQQGENAETIRRDIAGILHTLNQAYENLYNNLLSDVAMDISSEIAALQGMLANDGLTGREFE
ncbi:5-bromo-4-chloroindolyl phosphate hydrolysis family protein [Faecalibacterium prausnitzii]|uniref:5-bromo-4-chloroindolyl phosphate hydrolysis family protein n=1 Tax=Faecalibacterium prausnitzii TaxID=853 RepID=UPI00101F9BE3|nr:5-bromo-4-chloroindolyl phosphate hydrolysis protein [Faecalibacterium prausnitzii]MSC71163.1 5-bromo-4-chloroindolyl phosphate hydrolysis protein [Faecalibacterium prausnitzii]MSC96162.1 5-bromo-4-chloroindolyl phosphate hydrolysis protein [Faecalibacterium prausnitzii]MSD36806.1 5-bromo-4-chloroindolyl phosphate hydrolysis protein [Faecalibacterium prausnitzii]MSD50844.1 5-bromo-4-chloroindolyl phosphate hydrolysis protein [Faecalibacterium prausnitzii]